MKETASGQRMKAGHNTRDFLKPRRLFPLLPVRHGLQKPTSIRMPGVFENLIHNGLFNDLACIHDDHPLRRLCNDSQVMGDQNDGSVQFLF